MTLPQNNSPEGAFVEAARRNAQREELEQAIASNINNEPDRHQWVDISFELRGSSALHYQILQRHHNLLALDAEMGVVVDDLTREWELQEAEIGSFGFEYRTLTYHSEDQDEHRLLAEEILHRVYEVDIADVDEIELSP